MKVLVDNYTTARTVICPSCNSVLEVSVKDLTSDVDGGSFLQCPLCKRTWSMTKEELLKKSQESDK